MVSILGMCLISYGPGKDEPSITAVHGASESRSRPSPTYGMSGALAGDLLAVMSAAASGVSTSTRVLLIALCSYTLLIGEVLVSVVVGFASPQVYMVLLRVCVPNEEDVHMPSLFGMIGFVSMVCFLPLFPILHLFGVEVQGMRSSSAQTPHSP